MHWNNLFLDSEITFDATCFHGDTSVCDFAKTIKSININKLLRRNQIESVFKGRSFVRMVNYFTNTQFLLHFIGR